MKFKNSFKTAITGLRTNKSRSFLTILGIVIGVTAIIVMMAVGQGAQNLILNQIKALGSKTLIIIPGREPKGPMDPSIVETFFKDSLKERDVEALKQKTNVPTLAKIMPLVFGVDTVAYEGETYRTTIFGTTDLVIQLYELNLVQGSFFSDNDIRARADVVVIGPRVKEKLFGLSDALGEKVKIKGRNFRVIGILEKKGPGSLVNFDEVAFVPYTTAQLYILGIKHFHRVVVEADKEENITQTVNDITTTLRNLHNITNPDKDDFSIETQVDIANKVSVITNVLTLFLTAIAAISLLVGGVGIMNIMLVSVTERTREIGLRKALGATDKNIMSQFLLEAVTLTAIGGIAGIILGAGLSFATALILSKVVGLSWQFTFPVEAAVLGFGVSAAIGLVFGLYPARQAAIKNPIDALRYE